LRRNEQENGQESAIIHFFRKKTGKSLVGFEKSITFAPAIKRDAPPKEVLMRK
jgi:hypothetical protein